MRTSLRIGVVAVGLVLAGCGGADTTPAGTPDAESTTTPPSASSPTPAETAGGADPAASTSDAPEAAVEALDFTAETVDGGTIDATTYAGRDVVLWMWAPW